MRLFARILFLEGYEELAEECAEELSELIGILGDAKDDETREVEEEKVLEEEEEDDENDTNNKENEEEFCKQFHCGQKTNLDDPQIFKCVVDIESHARTMSSGVEIRRKERRLPSSTYRCRRQIGMLDKLGGSLLFSTRTARTTWLNRRYEDEKKTWKQEVFCVKLMLIISSSGGGSKQ